MITQEFINSDLGYVLNALGYGVSNAALWREELGDNAPTEDAILAKWEEIKAERSSQQSALDAYNTELSIGYDTGLGYRLSCGRNSYLDFSAFRTWIMDAEAVGAVNPSTTFEIRDKDGVKRQITVANYKLLLVPYGVRCKQIWDMEP